MPQYRALPRQQRATAPRPRNRIIRRAPASRATFGRYRVHDFFFGFFFFFGVGSRAGTGRFAAGASPTASGFASPVSSASCGLSRLGGGGGSNSAVIGAGGGGGGG